MDTRHWLMLALGCSLVATATWAACHWWYGRKLGTAEARLEKCDKARLFSVQQTMLARKQIEAMQKDLAAQHRAMAEAQVERQRSTHLEEMLKAAAEAEAEEEALAKRPQHGFADTQPMA